MQVSFNVHSDWELFLILPPLGRNQSAISITLSCLFIFVEQYSRYKRAAYTRLKRHFIGIRTIQVGCADGGYRGTFRNYFLMNFTISELIYRKDFRFTKTLGCFERTFAWMNGSWGRLSKDYETSCCSAKTMIMISLCCYTLKTPM